MIAFLKNSNFFRTWQLDPTEGPLRIRKRLVRGRLNIKAKHLMDRHQQKIGNIFFLHLFCNYG